MAGGGHLLAWDIPPKDGQVVYFSRDLYEKYSLSPSLTELLLLSKRQTKGNVDSLQPGSGKKTLPGQARSKSAGAAVKPLENLPLPEPRVPYPLFSSLTEKEQRRYLFLLSAYSSADPSLIDPSEQKDYSQYLQMKEFVGKEVAEFLKFAQNAARSCADDYEGLSEDALRYTKDFLSTQIGCVKRYPESYNLHEVTSIMGGRIPPELTLKFQKCLLALGKVSFIKWFFPKLPAPIHMPVDHKYDSDAPEQKANAVHQDISSDLNAEKLSRKYRPHVVLTSESLYTLLNNYGMDYKEQWELPVLVKMVSNAGMEPVKLAFVDPPLPKKEMTTREKNCIFHEFLADFHMTKKSSVLAHALLLDKAPERPMETPHSRNRQVQSSDSCVVDFETDVTELETFASTSKPLSSSRQGSSLAKPPDVAKTLPEHLKTPEEAIGDLTDVNRLTFSPPCETSKAARPPAKPAGISKTLLEHLRREKESMQKREKDLAEEPRSDNAEWRAQFSSKGNADQMPSTSGTDNLDGDVDNSKPAALEKFPNPSEAQVQETDFPKGSGEELPKDFDPLGQILKLQTELLGPRSSSREEQPQVTPGRGWSSTPGEGYTPSRTSGSSVLEPGPNAGTDINSSSKLTWLSYFQESQKTDLHWDEVEDRSRYEPPPQGNLIYKLFSLGDMLLMVRSVVQKVEQRPRHKKAKVRRHFPVYTLPKLEYQAFYGVEALTEGEMCRLWMENLLHSNSSFAIGHIDALTSNLFLLEQLSAEDLKKRFGTFKPANSLNVLNHILKKVTGLQEGSYLLSHAAGESSVTIYKSCEENPTRASYNLHAAHSDLPRVPCALSVPWVPLDPSIPLPHHMTQGRVPCTFPPKPADSAKPQARQMSSTKAHPGAPRRRQPVSKEASEDHRRANPVRKRRGAAQKNSMMRTVFRQANRGPNWKFWKESKHD